MSFPYSYGAAILNPCKHKTLMPLGFVTEEIIKGIHATRTNRWDYYYFRTKNGAEVDLILDGGFGILPIEIKFGQQTSVKQLTALRQFVEQHELPLGVVVNNHTEVKMLTDKIIQIPAGCL